MTDQKKKKRAFKNIESGNANNMEAFDWHSMGVKSVLGFVRFVKKLNVWNF